MVGYNRSGVGRRYHFLDNYLGKKCMIPTVIVGVGDPELFFFGSGTDSDLTWFIRLRIRKIVLNQNQNYLPDPDPQHCPRYQTTFPVLWIGIGLMPIRIRILPQVLHMIKKQIFYKTCIHSNVILHYYTLYIIFSISDSIPY
jgi:hypothetical protein